MTFTHKPIIVLTLVCIVLAGCFQPAPENDPDTGQKPPCAWDSGDYDNDSVPNSVEEELGMDPCNPDTDNDTLDDGTELYGNLTDPLSNDTDNDGLLDADDPAPTSNESDYDNDGVLDQYDINPWYDVVARWSAQWNWTGDNMEFGIEVDDVILDTHSQNGNHTGNWTEDRDWPDNQKGMLCKMNQNGYKFSYLFYAQNSTWQHNYTDHEGELWYWLSLSLLPT